MHPFWIRGCACAAQCARECGLRPFQRARLPTVARLLDSSPTTCNAQALGGQARYLLHACLKRRKLARTMCSNLLFIFLAEKWLRNRNQKWQAFSSLRPRARCSAQRATRARTINATRALNQTRAHTRKQQDTQRATFRSAAESNARCQTTAPRTIPWRSTPHYNSARHTTTQDNTRQHITSHHTTPQHNATQRNARNATPS